MSQKKMGGGNSKLARPDNFSRDRLHSIDRDSTDLLFGLVLTSLRRGRLTTWEGTRALLVGRETSCREGATGREGCGARRRTIRRKNLLLDQRKIDLARRIFEPDTVTEAIHRALDAAADLAASQRELAARLLADY